VAVPAHRTTRGSRPPAWPTTCLWRPWTSRTSGTSPSMRAWGCSVP